jgi:hypothetical protein
MKNAREFILEEYELYNIPRKRGEMLFFYIFFTCTMPVYMRSE